MDVDHGCQLKQRGCGSPATASCRGTTSARDCVPAATQPSSISQPVREEPHAAVLGTWEMPTKSFRFSAIAEASSATIAPNDNEHLARKSAGCGRPARIRGMHPVDQRLRNTLFIRLQKKEKNCPRLLACTSLRPLHRAATQRGSAVRIFGSQHALPRARAGQALFALGCN